jgi:import receptor subunit TOM22
MYFGNLNFFSTMKLTEITDAVEDDGDEEFVDEDNLDEEIIEEEEEDVWDRLYALQDILPPVVRAKAYVQLDKSLTVTGKVIKAVGNGLWILATACIILVLPTSFEIEREAMVLEQQMQQHVLKQQ